MRVLEILIHWADLATDMNKCKYYGRFTFHKSSELKPHTAVAADFPLSAMDTFRDSDLSIGIYYCGVGAAVSDSSTLLTCSRGSEHGSAVNFVGL